MKVIIGNAGSIPKDILYKMYAMRHTVFRGRMNWDVIEPLPGLECDQFDDMDPLYGVCVEHFAERGWVVLGCWRLLPTTGPYMLRDVFRGLLHGHLPEESGAVWEISRFAVASDDGWGRMPDSTISHATRLLLDELFRLGVRLGIRRFVACSDVRFQRILRLVGVSVGTYGPAMPIGNTIAVGGWADVDGHLGLTGGHAEDAREAA